MILFVNIDTQHDFFAENKPLYIQGSEEIVENLQILTEFAKEQNIKVINSQLWHSTSDPDLSDDPDFSTTYPHHCLAHSEGSFFIPETQPIAPYIVDIFYENINRALLYDVRNINIRKNSFDMFDNPHADEIFNDFCPDHIVVYGVASDMNVDQALDTLVDYGPVMVVEDAIKEVPGTDKAELYKKWYQLGVDFISTSELTKLKSGLL